MKLPSCMRFPMASAFATSYRPTRVTPLPDTSSQRHSVPASPARTCSVAPLTAPYHVRAPWPAMRGRFHNSGCEAPTKVSSDTSIAAMPIRTWRTGNSIFSTPIIGPDEMIYVGSADKKFYALDPLSGKEKWHFATDECIDSAACIDSEGTLFVASCDGRIYALDEEGREKWRFNALKEYVGYTPSTIYWWEGNITLGPTGLLYAGNDNFYLYALDRQGNLRWAHPTGLNIWSAPTFDEAGKMYGASFDMHVYCLDALSGKVAWRRNIDNVIAASPALGSNGLLFVGHLGGALWALEQATGKKRWHLQTAGHIYASAAVAADNMLYVGSSDGKMYAVEQTTGKVVWTFYTGDAIRSSASLGPDPEKKAPYLIYFGGGNGLIYALAPDGSRRWSFDTKQYGGPSQYHNINASIALGDYGLATASASGDVLWIPYSAYLSQASFDCTPGDKYPCEGFYLNAVTVGGAARPADEAQPILVQGAEALAWRPLMRQGGQTVATELGRGDVSVSITPPLPHRVIVHANGQQVSVVPLALPTPSVTYTVHVEARLTQAEAPEKATATLRLRAQEVGQAPTLEQLKQIPLRLSHIAIYEPNIVPSFDQIGLASLAIDIQVVDVDPKTRAIIAWGVLPFGAACGDEAVGVPHRRTLRFAFSGTYQNGHILLESVDPWFEITALPVPLDRLRLTGCIPAKGGVADGGSLLAEVRTPTFANVGKSLLQGREPTLLKVLRHVRPLETRPQGGQGPAHRRRGWSLIRQNVGFFWHLIRRKPYQSWGLIDSQRAFAGQGTYRMMRRSAADMSGIEVQTLHYNRCHQRVDSQITLPADGDAALLSVLIINKEQGVAVPLDYNALTATQKSQNATSYTVRLCLPRNVGRDGHRYEAVLLYGTQTLQRILLT